MSNNGNIILNKIVIDNSLLSFKEFIPAYEPIDKNQFLAYTPEGSICWDIVRTDCSIIVNNQLKDTDIYYDSNGRIGIGRYPLHNYKVDVAISKNSLSTAFHIGDGSFGFSMGNGTSQGFVPEIIGIGSDENDAGLYFVGVASNDNSSNVPVILLDGRNAFGEKITNRPILGVTSGDYNKYLVSIDSSGNLNVQNDLIIDNKSLLTIIKNLQLQIDELKTKIT